MPTPETIRARLTQLKQAQRPIHITATLPDRRGTLTSAPVTITGTYPHIFQVEEQAARNLQHYTFPYSDVLIGAVKIDEL